MQRTMWRGGAAAVLGAIALCLSHVSKIGAMEFLGQAGVLGEWELTGNLTEGGSGPHKEFSGPLKMKHVGICNPNGPEERAGEIRLQLTGRSESRVDGQVGVGRHSLYIQRAQDARLRGHDVVRRPRTCSVAGVAQIVHTMLP